MIKRDYSEKRDFIRMTINTPAAVQVVQNDVLTHGICNDLSGSGMLLTVDEDIAVDSELLVTLMPPEKNAPPMLQARCTVARSRQAADKQFLLGLEIIEILAEKETDTDA